MSVRFAVVGCGTAANHIHLPLLRAAGAEVSAFSSRSRSSAEATQERWGSGAVEEDWTAAVAREDVDAVLVAAPNAAHCAIALAAIEAGKSVLVDKPLACTVDETDRMIAAAGAAGVVLVPFQNTRFLAPFVAAQRTVADGAIGEVTGVRAAFGHAGPQAWAPRATWFFERQHSGGGCLIDLGVHVIDLVRFATGQEIVEVSAELRGTWRPTPSSSSRCRTARSGRCTPAGRHGRDPTTSSRSSAPRARCISTAAPR